jgi:arsenate reductase
MTAHWGIRDPAAVEGGDAVKRRAFQTAFTELQRRITLFINLPFDTLKGMALQERLDAIGRSS